MASHQTHASSQNPAPSCAPPPLELDEVEPLDHGADVLAVPIADRTKSAGAAPDKSDPLDLVLPSDS